MADTSRDTTGLATIAGHKGAIIINDTSSHTIEGSLIQFSADAVVTSLGVNGAAATLTDYITTPANPTGLNAIAPLNGGEFSEITLSAGTCTVVR